MGDLGAGERWLAEVLARVVGGSTRPHRQVLDVHLQHAGHDPRDEHTGQVDLVRTQLAHLDDLVHLGDGQPGGLREADVKVAAAAAEPQIAHLIGSVGADQREVGGDGAFEYVRSAIEVSGVLAFGDRGADRDRRVDGRQPSAAGPHPFHQRALRHHLQRHPARLDRPLGLRDDAGAGGEAG